MRSSAVSVLFPSPRDQHNEQRKRVTEKPDDDVHGNLTSIVLEATATENREPGG
jgi:hypothetical protein